MQRTSRRNFLIGASLAPLSACITRRDFNSAPTINYVDVLMQLKHDVGTYILRHKGDIPVVAPPAKDASAQEKATYWANVREKLARPPGDGEACITQVSFSISKVKVKIATSYEKTNDVSLDLKVPVGVATLGPGMSASRTGKQSLETSLTVYPSSDLNLNAPLPPPSATFQGTPISDTLEALAAAMRQVAAYGPVSNSTRIPARRTTRSPSAFPSSGAGRSRASWRFLSSRLAPTAI